MPESQPTNERRSAFPGMDPYLESYWSDVHPRMTTYASDQLQRYLPQGLVARIEQYVVLEDETNPDTDHVSYRPDMAAFDEGGSGTATATVADMSTAAEPVLVPRPEPPPLRRITILESSSGRLVTVIEVLSPAIKRGDQAVDFRAKQDSFLRAGVNVVQIDLLRQGRWVLSAPEQWAPLDVSQPYRVCVVRAHRQATSEMYRISLREPLPTIRIPLRVDDADVPLDLQRLVDDVYAHGRYGSIDYTQPPDPPLVDEDARWANELLDSKGKR
jgi:hypothetical protein